MRSLKRAVMTSAIPAVAAMTVLGAAAASAGRIDTQAPVLTRITTIGSVNTDLPNQQIEVDLHINDDLSGVIEYGIQYTSPSGLSHVSRTKKVVTPLLHLSPTLDFGTWPVDDPGFNVFTEPGTWQADSFYVKDAQQNIRTYDGDQLAALGTTTFVVTSSGYDLVPSSLASGTIDTPVVKRSKQPKGTTPGTPPYVSATLNVTDAGNGRVSGTYAVSMVLCHAIGGEQCDDTMVLDGTTNRSGLVANTMPVGLQMRTDQTPGQYVIKQLTLVDWAGNAFTYLSQDFGGDTDFTKFFPSGATVFVSQ